MDNYPDLRSYPTGSNSSNALIQQSARSVAHDKRDDTEHTCSTRRIRHSKVSLALDLAVDAVLLAFGIAFLALAVVSLRYNDKPVSENQEVTDALLDGAKFGTTLLPIIFAVVVGRACKSIFVWRLERGERIGTLDLLAGSTSLASTLLTHLSLRSFVTSVSPVLLVIWVLSPLGSQASLRVVTKANVNNRTSKGFPYLTSNYADLFLSVNNNNVTAPILTTLFTSSILAPTDIKKSPRDLWFHVKTPMIEPFEQDADATTDDDWYKVPNDNTTIYSSFIGTPIGNLSSDASYAAMNIESSYWHLKCEPLFHQEPEPDELNSAWQRLDCDPSDSHESPEKKRCIRFSQTVSLNDHDDGTSFAACSIATTFVELQVDCERGLCAATRVRRSHLLSNPPAPWTYLDQGVKISDFDYGIAEDFIDRYIVDPEHITKFEYSILPHELGPDVFGIRYTQILNSFWKSFSNFIGLDDDYLILDSRLETSTAEGSETVTTEVIRCHMRWMWILVTASMIMILATLLHATLLFITKAPKQLNINVSSLVRDNRYVLFPMTGSAADASQRARQAKNCRVRYGDVQPEETVGHLAIGSVDEKGGIVERVRLDRYYD